MCMSNACLNFVASFKSLACTLEEELQRQEQHHVILLHTGPKCLSDYMGYNSAKQAELILQ